MAIAPPTKGCFGELIILPKEEHIDRTSTFYPVWRFLCSLSSVSRYRCNFESFDKIHVNVKTVQARLPRKWFVSVPKKVNCG